MSFHTRKRVRDIAGIRIACQLAAEVLEMIEPHIQPGMSTGDLNSICHRHIIRKQNAFPASLGYHGFPGSICTSVNETVCHGIPSFEEKLKVGDILNVDVAILKDGFYGDASRMYMVGEISGHSRRLCEVAKRSLYMAIGTVHHGSGLGEIGKIIQDFVEAENFSVVREYCGHGIGRALHEEPQVLHHRNDNNLILSRGLVFTIEPMINAGGAQTYVSEDGWAVKTRDGSLSAQYEHTILVTEEGCEIMTLGRDEDVFCAPITSELRSAN